MRFISLVLGKVILKLLRLMGRDGSALPGLVVEKINPLFLNHMLGKLPQGVLLITGTNGKTTTTKVVASLLEAQGLRVLTNKSGSNFVRGIVTTVVSRSTLGGKLPYDIAVIEQDEAHAVHFVHQVRPRGVAVLNIMRDQMDRFGEIDTTAKMLQEVVSSATEWVVLNGNDSRVGALQVPETAKTYWFGHSRELQASFLTDDELHHQDKTAYVLQGDLGCELTGYDGESIQVKQGENTVTFATGLRGTHNAINLTAALSVLSVTLPEADPEKTKQAVADLQPAFGRGENFQLQDGTNVTLQLVKNPGGFTHALRMLDVGTYDVIGIAINDDYADGRDVSWLWDVDFNRLENTDKPVLCGGVRGYDMANRLKYDGVPTTQVATDLRDFVSAIHASTAGKSVIIFCTYTAMLKIRGLYKKHSKDVYGVEV
jgi:UDP-N-acetylmuramyl tripeptide synthase